MAHGRILSALVTASALAILMVACGGGGSPSSPSPQPPPPGGGGGGGGTGSTITITSSGVSPKAIQISVGSRVTFVNNDSRNHEMNSDPHPDHTDCPPINDVGFITPRQTKETGNFVAPRTCGYHDHNDPFNTNLQGTVAIQ